VGRLAQLPRASGAVLWPLAGFALVVITLAMSAEIVLQYRAALRAARRPLSPIEKLDRDYQAFIVQHLHPRYLFFFPLRPEDRVAMGNAVVSIDRDGFREPGPTHAGGRKLAVLLGGSTAFGQYASSNDGTITSFLNRLQQEYFFVNAGVPSWNSSQELQRLTLEIIEMKPALVIAFDGANDGALSGENSPRTGLAYPPGTPESFGDLERWVDDLRSDRWLLRPPTLFPELRYRLDLLRDAADADEPVDNIRDEVVAAAAREYRANQRRMSLLVRASGGRFMSVFQPVASMHRNVPPAYREEGEGELGRRFHQFVIDAGPVDYEFHDLSRYFDSRFASIPVGEPTAAEEPIFVDDVHFYERGNEIVARHLLGLIAAGPAP
jgi:hypothetical protein